MFLKVLTQVPKYETGRHVGNVRDGFEWQTFILIAAHEHVF